MNIYTLAIAFDHQDEKNRVLNGRIFTIKKGFDKTMTFIDVVTDKVLLITDKVVSEQSTDYDAIYWVKTEYGATYAMYRIERILPTMAIEELNYSAYETYSYKRDIEFEVMSSETKIINPSFECTRTRFKFKREMGTADFIDFCKSHNYETKQKKDAACYEDYMEMYQIDPYTWEHKTYRRCTA